MDLITYALARKAMTSSGATGAQISSMTINEAGELIVKLSDGTEINAGKVPTTESGVITQIQGEVTQIQQDITALQKAVITEIQLNGVAVNAENNVLNLPLASGDVIGLVKGTLVDSENSVNKISINNDGTMEVISLSTDKLDQGEKTLILDCSTVF